MGWGDLRLDDLAFLDEATHSTFTGSEIRVGDVLLNITGASIGRSAVAIPALDGGNVNQHVCEVRLKSSMNPDFVCAVLNSQIGQRQIDTFQAGGNRQGLNFKQVGSIRVPRLGISDQNAVASAINHTDDLIASLRRLIAKKRAVKHGMMQELLTGRTRLPGFDGEWITLHVASVSHLKARIGWQGLTTGEYRTSGHYRLVGGTDFRDGKVNWSTTPYVDKWRFDQDRNIQLRVGDVLITKDGTIGKVAFVDSLPGPTTLNSGVFVVRPKNDSYDSGFLFHMLRSRFFDEFVAGLSAGSTINHLYQRDLVTLELRVPPTLDEQRAIAEALNDADTEIEALERHLQVTRDIKQGMMQELLTGRTRLPVDEEVAV